MVSQKDKIKRGILCPGQGCQKIEMGLDLLSQHQIAKDICKKLKKVSSFDFQEIVSSEEALKQSLYAQIAIFTTCVMSFEVNKKNESDENFIDFVAGHSLGEYTALYVSGVLSFENALDLLTKRAKFIQECCEKTEGGMLAIIGSDEKTIQELIDASKDGNEILIMANYNSSSQVVLSGHLSAIEKAANRAKDFDIKRAIRLNVAGAFHSPLMSEANDKLANEIEKVLFLNPNISFISSSVGKLLNQASDIKDILKNQIINPVRWTEVVKTMREYDVQNYTELYGNVLTKLF